MRQLTLATALFTGLITGLSASVFAAPVYKWVDEKGVTHFTAEPPAGQNSQEVNIKVAPGKPSTTNSAEAIKEAQSNDDKQKAIDDKVKADVAKKEKERAEYCQQTRENLAQLRNNPRVRVEENGEQRFLSDDERQQRISQAEGNIKEVCE
ncbi:DUF4124 domain-containing protein [Atopomonas sediminilitoris]|uniref:DUF4124 domain-containing protein n=1 Tax=Atopomonas sediminilitoris TaxID=2919919 RepID=UPI001F4E49E4|nr:DUF4124 domain-containing protein [Atopomonas sediminilitoris]MCJ8169937.1 DUF4124 domain-containing protein [Atopomonas sediminilitoris]